MLSHSRYRCTMETCFRRLATLAIRIPVPKDQRARCIPLRTAPRVTHVVPVTALTGGAPRDSVVSWAPVFSTSALAVIVRVATSHSVAKTVAATARQPPSAAHLHQDSHWVAAVRSLAPAQQARRRGAKNRRALVRSAQTSLDTFTASLPVRLRLPLERQLQRQRQPRHLRKRGLRQRPRPQRQHQRLHPRRP